MQKDVAVKIMKIKPGAKQESLTELPYTEAAIAGICIHANIVQTMYSDLMPVLDSSSAQEGGGSFWSKAKDDRASRSLARSDSSVKEWQVRMVMEICDLGAASCTPAMLLYVASDAVCVLGALLPFMHLPSGSFDGPEPVLSFVQPKQDSRATSAEDKG